MSALFAILGTALSMVYLVAAFAIVVGCIGHWVIERRKRCGNE